MSRAVPPPRSDIPRNLSYIAGLYERAYYRTARPSLEEDDEEEESDEDGATNDRSKVAGYSRGRDAKAAGPSSPGTRRRARSAPADRTRAEAAALRSCSPNTRKTVRFADSLGLELANVRHFRQSDVPRIPAHVQAKLHHDAISHFGPCQLGMSLKDSTPRTVSTLEPTFTDPGLDPCFVERVCAQMVCLESAHVESFFISGWVRVLNVAFEKRVGVRYTTDNWSTHHDARAAYVPRPACAGVPPPRTDRFTFCLPLPVCLSPGGSMQFAVCYQVGEDEYWDNNGGANYSFCAQVSEPFTPRGSENGWLHFL
ncbi:protein phosphatase 1 regulatory subunit 3E [Ambystoma mexicanum]|uniref:protein phosphatase 1 regulatory subunit 3E n=1 Tax=Ambystoma mexicanum TaxID=8296 RepID=UPI0037E9C479